MPRQLTEKQERVYECLQQHGFWRLQACGWTYGTSSQTKKAMDSLVKHGFASIVKVDGEEDKYVPIEWPQ